MSATHRLVERYKLLASLACDSRSLARLLKLPFGPVDTSQRSICNVVFTLEDPELESTFLKEASSEGLEYLKGHRTVGGMRASIYNPMKIDSVLALKEFMVNFEKKYG